MVTYAVTKDKESMTALEMVRELFVIYVSLCKG